MKYKKLLFVIIIIIGVMFSLMLATSYAWYSFSAGSTTFNAVTSDKDVDVRFIKGEYINNTLAVPISNSEIDQYSDKHQFIVRTKNNKENNQILLKISLVDIDTNLNDKSFYVELYYQGEKVSTVTGNQLSVNGEKTKLLKTVELEDDVDNNFEVRVYLLDNGSEQNTLMNKNFSAKIQTEVVSRLKTNISDYSDADIRISSITIDGASSDSLPVDGYYTMSSTCSKGSALSWNKYSKTITYSKGSKVGDSCSLVFTKDTSTKLLNTVSVGSYVKYMGNNGCDGNHCAGDNANYVSDDDMGYCGNSYYGFIVNGWRVAYIKDNSAYLVSAGAPECVATYVENISASTSDQSLSSNYYYGSGYVFDEVKGKYRLTGVTSTTLAWSSNYNSIIENTPYTCKTTSSSGSCTTMYKVIAYSSSSQGKVITYNNYDGAGVVNHIAHLNKAALKYCNTNYAYNGVCDVTSSWSINDSDYQMITTNIGTKKTLSNCSGDSGSRACGFNNDLIDNGGYYWFATPDSASSTFTFHWYPYSRLVISYASNCTYGVRPVLRLRSSVSVMSGSGTYKDPYVIQ